MTLKEIVDKLGATVGLGSDKLDMEVEQCFASDLMSDVLAHLHAVLDVQDLRHPLPGRHETIVLIQS